MSALQLRREQGAVAAVWWSALLAQSRPRAPHHRSLSSGEPSRDRTGDPLIKREAAHLTTTHRPALIPHNYGTRSGDAKAVVRLSFSQFGTTARATATASCRRP